MALPARSGHHQRMTMTLLLVDDSELILASLRGLLEGIPGINAIRSADSLAHALDSVRLLPPTLVVLDLHLADGNAITVIPRIKQLAPRAQIAMLTNDATQANRNKCLAAGAHWFFDKSTEYETLLDVVRTHAAQQELINNKEGNTHE